MNINDILKDGGIPKGKKMVIVGGAGPWIGALAAIAGGAKSGDKVILDVESDPPTLDGVEIQLNATFDRQKYREYQLDAVKFIKDKVLIVDDGNPFKALEHHSNLIEAHLNGKRDPEMQAFFKDWDRAAQADGFNLTEATPEERPEDLPKRNVNGKRMANQPLDRRQNYLTLRNKRW